MPKKMVAYVCDLCGAMYNTEKEAHTCEHSHLTSVDPTPKEHTCSECWWYMPDKSCILGMVTNKVEPNTPACKRFDV